MKKRIICGLIMISIMGVVLSGCTGDKTNNKNEAGKETITVGYPRADETWANDDYFKYITDKMDVNIEFRTLPYDSAAEKARIWISSGDMPDILWYGGIMMDEYVKYGKQGLVKALPQGWQEKYPNLGFSMAMTGISDTLEEIGEGEYYALIRPLDNYYRYTEDFRKAYDEGKDLRAMMQEPQYKAIDDYGFAYRKDWAEQLGIETDYIMEYDKFIDMIKKFKEADLGGVGKENTVGIAIDYTEAPNFFVTAFNSSYKYIHKDETGKYVCGLTEDETVEGIKEYANAYRTGILAPDFYTQKSQDLNSLFCSQRSGVIFPKANAFYLRQLNSDFTKANPGLKAEDCIGVCWVLSPDGKVHGRSSGNYYGGYYFNPEMSDEKFDKVLSLADYVSSKAGGPQVMLGVPDVDYKVEGDYYSVLRERNENGTLDTLDKKYPSYTFFKNFLNTQYSQTDEVDPYAVLLANGLADAKREYELSLLEWDDKRDGYTADDYVKFNAAYEVNAMFAEIVVSEGDIEDNWNKKRAEIDGAVKGVLENMNKALK